ncbi:MAG: hypothetical protein RL701_4956, partial [Pseudomonadota bacterium]
MTLARRALSVCRRRTADCDDCRPVPLFGSRKVLRGQGGEVSVTVCEDLHELAGVCGKAAFVGHLA